MFDPTDIYAVSSGATLFNYWNPIVTKFDSSAFYNWETDNLPLHDLEERTYHLWEKATGWATSALPGLALCVSSSIPTSLETSANVFTSLQDAIDALPQVLRQPTLIEVAVSGDLGDIQLHNISCEGSGSLEIVNRVFAPFDPSSAKWTERDATHHSVWQVSSSEATDHITNTSALSFSANTSDLWATQLGYVGVAQMTNPRSSRSLRSQKLSVALAQGQSQDDFGVDWKTGNEYRTPDLTYTAGSVITDTTFTTMDVSSNNGAGTRLKRTIIPSTSDLGANGFVTNNSMRSLRIANCNGPIWIRRFAVVAATGATAPYTSHADSGIKVLESDGVTLEDMVVTRATKRGLDVVSSDLTLRRRFVSDRNYDPSTRGDAVTAGIYAVNSNLHFMGDSVLSGNAVLFSVANHDVGIELRNTTVTSENAGELHVNHCDTGIKAVGSHLDFQGKLDIWGCHTGLMALGSEVDLYELVSQYCDEAGVKGTNSTFRYGAPDVDPATSLTSVGGGTLITKDIKYLLHANGQHLVLDNCVWDVVRKDNNVTSTAATLIADHFKKDLSSILPAIDLVNTKAVLAQTRVATGASTFGGSSDGQGGAGQLAEGYLVKSRGADVTFLGTSAIASILTGFVDGDNGGAAVASVEGGHVRFKGPTFIGAASVDCLADDNGHVEFTRNDVNSFNGEDTKNHTSVQLHAIRANLAATNNSTIIMKDLGDAVEAWGTAAGDASAIDLRGRTELSSTWNGGGMSLLCSNEQNSIKPHENGTYADKYNYTLEPGTYFKFTNSTLNSTPYSYYLADIESMTDADFRSDISNGGTLVRAHNDSTVKVSNVNFFQGQVNADGVFYDSSIPAGCNDLRIWTITGNSVLDAAHMSCSGTWPSQAGYTGPRAAYLSGTDPYDGSSVAYAAFLGNPYNGDASSVSGVSDTSTLSILDFYGSGVTVSANHMSAELRAWSFQRYGGATDKYGASGYANQGPFRVYFDVDPAARLLSYASGGVFYETDTRPYQTMAQGYELSASCSSVPSLAMSYYPKLMIWDEKDSEFDSSGYYTTSSFVDPGKQTVRLDESAAEMFANCKNAARPQRGRPSLVDIYRSTTLSYGLYKDISVSGTGFGFKGTTDFDLRRI